MVLRNVVKESPRPAFKPSEKLLPGPMPPNRTTRTNPIRINMILVTSTINSRENPEIKISRRITETTGSLIKFLLKFHMTKSIRKILKRSAGILEVEISESGLTELAKRSRGTPRVANRLLRRVRDYAQVKGDGVITDEMANEALKLLDIDGLGLDDVDRRILKTIIGTFNGGPVGIDTLAAIIDEEPITIEDVYEPYLLRLGFINRTPRGRCVTRLAYEHLGIPYNKGNGTQLKFDTNI